MARASILWLVGEYAERVPKVAPDVLRKMAKSFGSEVKNLWDKDTDLYEKHLYVTDN